MFKEYVKTVGKGNDQHAVVIQARQSSGDETVMTTGGPRNVKEGEYVIKTSNPNVFDVNTKEQWSERKFDNAQQARK